MIRVVRLLATAVAGLALAALGWHSGRPLVEPRAGVAEVTLWTAGANSPTGPRSGTDVALPGVATAPANALRLPDTAGLRRNFPALRRVTIEGDGVDAGDAEALRDLEVVWRPPGNGGGGGPAFVHVSAPRTLAIGQAMNVQGRLAGLPPGAATTVTLQGPDGSKQATAVTAAADGEAAFALTAAAGVVAAGNFEWKLQAGPGEPLVLGVAVAEPPRPRVLLLQAAPTNEGARLQRWLAADGAAVSTRTRVSAERVRFAGANGAPAEFAHVDAATLAAFDAVIATETALGELAASERDALDAAIRDGGIGLLVIGEPSSAAPETRFAPWQLRADSPREEADPTQLARLRLSDGTEWPEPIPVIPADLGGAAGHGWIARDSQGRTLVAAMRRGRGWLARSLVTDSWHWLQSGQAPAFAHYWSLVLSTISRPVETSAGGWQVENGTQPLFVGLPVRLVRGEDPAAGLRAAEVVRGTAAGTAPLRLPLGRDPNEPTRASVRFWPAHAGWHEVRRGPDDTPAAFYVLEAVAAPGVRRQERHDTTARLAASGRRLQQAAPASLDSAGAPPLAVWAWFALFTAGAGWLWWEQRR